MNEQPSNAKWINVFAMTVGIIAGIPYLLATPKVQPPEQPYAIMGVVQVILFIGGFILTFKYHKKAWVITLFLLLGIQIVVLGRMIFDSISDPRSHHMWPFEFVVSTILCAPISFIGTFLGYFVQSILKKRRLTSHSS